MSVSTEAAARFVALASAMEDVGVDRPAIGAGLVGALVICAQTDGVALEVVLGVVRTAWAALESKSRA